MRALLRYGIVSSREARSGTNIIEVMQFLPSCVWDGSRSRLPSSFWNGIPFNPGK